jgi:hypothetical protein
MWISTVLGNVQDAHKDIISFCYHANGINSFIYRPMLLEFPFKFLSISSVRIKAMDAASHPAHSIVKCLSLSHARTHTHTQLSCCNSTELEKLTVVPS